VTGGFVQSAEVVQFPQKFVTGLQVSTCEGQLAAPPQVFRHRCVAVVSHAACAPH
jgi:hypothetical protein